jgi:hypothetical protein
LGSSFVTVSSFLEFHVVAREITKEDIFTTFVSKKINTRTQSGIVNPNI